MKDNRPDAVTILLAIVGIIILSILSVIIVLLVVTAFEEAGTLIKNMFSPLPPRVIV